METIMKRDSTLLDSDHGITIDPVDGMSSLDELNGNWDDIRNRLADQVRGDLDGSIIARSINANSRAAQQAMFGGVVQFDDPEVNRGTVSLPTRSGSVVRTFWWGFHVQLSLQDMQALTANLGFYGELGNSISSVAPANARPWIALVSVFIRGAVALINAVNRGRGVYISMSWFAPGIFVVTPV
jgi:hypothetical protein